MRLALRPRFELELTRPSPEALEGLCRHLEQTPLILRRTRVPGGGHDHRPRADDHLVLTVPLPQQHFWSPWLTIELSARGTSTHLAASFSPHPSVWTGFAFGYLGLGLVCAVALTIAGSGALLPDSSQPWAWWVAAGTALALIAMWGASMIGQRFAHDQMQQLRDELDRAIDACRAT